ncbi:hypothetical protein N8T08_005312 [Aspergillus melleus]|uniref:Uncharacterized protein n=1 Tax=Aspergillus melleus TaxID=138277 RepID=A0ACC3BG33_9EURO|nr:hypothetical protein N8T08_005312 [Aspergillus melleus]
MERPVSMKLLFLLPNETKVLLTAATLDNLHFNIIFRRALERLSGVPREPGLSQIHIPNSTGGHYIVQDQMKLCFTNHERRVSHEEWFYIDVGGHEQSDPSIDVILGRDSDVLPGIERNGKPCAPILPKAQSPDEKEAQERKFQEEIRRATEEEEKIRKQEAEENK